MELASIPRELPQFGRHLSSLARPASEVFGQQGSRKGKGSCGCVRHGISCDCNDRGYCRCGQSGHGYSAAPRSGEAPHRHRMAADMQHDDSALHAVGLASEAPSHVLPTLAEAESPPFRLGDSSPCLRSACAPLPKPSQLGICATGFSLPLDEIFRDAQAICMDFGIPAESMWCFLHCALHAMMDPLPSLVLTALWEAYECFFWPFELPLDEHVWDAIFCDRAGDICRGLIHNGKPGLPIKALPGILV